MRAVNLIPAEQRSGQPVGAGRSQGGAYAVLALLAGLALLALLYGNADHHDLQPQRAGRRAHGRGAAGAGGGRTARAVHELRRDARTAHAGRRRARRLALRLGSRLPRIRPRAAAPRRRSPRSAARSAHGTAATAAARARAHDHARRRSAAAARASPRRPRRGSVPTFTLTGCATSQPSVALMLERLRLIDGVSEVTLQSSTTGRSARRLGARGSAVPPTTPASRRRSPSIRCRATSAVAAATKTVSDSTTLRGHRARERARKMTGRDRIVLMVIVVARDPRRGVDPGRLARAPEGEQAQRPGRRTRRPNSAAPKASCPTPAPPSRSTRRPTPRSSASAKRCRRARKCPSLIDQLTQAADQKNVEFASITDSAQLERAPRAPPSASPSAAAADAPAFTQLPFTFIFEGSFFDLEHLFSQLDRLHDAQLPGRPRGQRPAADDPERQARARSDSSSDNAASG